MSQARPVLERYFERLGKPDSKGCRRWDGGHAQNGNPRIWFNGKTRDLHRVIYSLLEDDSTERPEPFVFENDRLEVSRTCGHRWCAARNHMFAVAHPTVMKLASVRGSLSHGEDHPNSRLTTKQVREIRKLRAEGWFVTTLAEKFKVSAVEISKIGRNLVRKHG